MKLRKNDFEVPKNLFVPRWIINDLHRGVSDFLHRDMKELIVYHASTLGKLDCHFISYQEMTIL